jgi:hypothetical protein
MAKLYEIFQQFKTKESRQAGGNRVVNLIKEGKIKAKDLNIFDVARATLGDSALMSLQGMDAEHVAVGLRESVDPVSLTLFSDITQLLVLEGAMEAYQSPDYIGDKLFKPETSRNDNVRKPGLALIDDDALVVPEGEEYPDVKFGQDYQDLPTSAKRGLKIGITREAIFFDNTGDILKRAASIGERIGTNKEKRQLRVFLGIVNNYNRNGTARNTYVATGGGDPRVNSLASNPLVDWHSVDAANQLFVGMTDDRTKSGTTIVGEPIQVTPDTIVVSKYKWMTAIAILQATQIRKGTNAAVDQTYGSNPLNMLPLNPLTSVWLDWLLVNEGSVSAVNAKDYWTIGQPKKAFTYRTLFPFQMLTAPANATAEFERDVLVQYRGSERGVAYVEAPWYVAQNHNA